MSAVRQVLLVLVGFAVAGALAGVVWEWLWAPPIGIALDREFLLDGGGLRSQFSGTALYVVVGTLAGLLVGVLVAVLAERHELLTLVAVFVGSVLAGWLMLRVGTALGPPDPEAVARTAEDNTPIRDALRVSGHSPFVAFPGGALVGLIVIFIGLNRREKSPG